MIQKKPPNFFNKKKNEILIQNWEEKKLNKNKININIKNIL